MSLTFIVEVALAFLLAKFIYRFLFGPEQNNTTQTYLVHPPGRPKRKN